MSYNKDDVDPFGNAGKYVTKETIKDVKYYPFMAMNNRGFSKDVMKRFGVKSSTCEEDNKNITASYFPHYDQEGSLCGYIKRDWEKTKDEPGHFTSVPKGGVKKKGMLFNQQNVTPGGKTLYITEGHEDCIAVEETLLESVRGTKWEGKIKPSVVSIPLGTGAAVDCIASNLDFVMSFDEIVLAFDKDSANIEESKKGILKGSEAKEAVAALLLTDKLYTVDYPNGAKDAREAYKNGDTEALAKALSFDKYLYSPEKIVSGNDIDIDSLIEPLREGVYIDRLPLLSNMLHGFRTGNELITYFAHTNAGKTTFVKDIAWELGKHNLRVGYICLEEPIKKTQQSLLALELGVKLAEFRANPLGVSTKDKIRQAMKNVFEDKTYFLDHFGSISVKKLVNQMNYLHFMCGCDHIVLDHVSMAIAGEASDNERKDLDMLYETMAKFMTINMVTIHAVCHIKRGEELKPKRGEEDEPFWATLSKQMLRGSSGIEGMSSCLIGLEHEVRPDGKRGLIRSKVLKDREWGDLGICDYMQQDKYGRIQSVSSTSSMEF